MTETDSAPHPEGPAKKRVSSGLRSAGLAVLVIMVASFLLGAYSPSCNVTPTPTPAPTNTPTSTPAPSNTPTPKPTATATPTPTKPATGSATGPTATPVKLPAGAATVFAATNIYSGVKVYLKATGEYLFEVLARSDDCKAVGNLFGDGKGVQIRTPGRTAAWSDEKTFMATAASGIWVIAADDPAVKAKQPLDTLKGVSCP
jgi:hypothetical protein